MRLDVEFFGFAYYIHPSSEDTWDFKPRYQFFIVLDISKNTKRPFLLWSMKYKNSKLLKEVHSLNKNSGLALLKMKSEKFKNAPIVIKNLCAFKLKFFGNNEIPIKQLTDEEWNKRYSKLNKSDNVNLFDLL